MCELCITSENPDTRTLFRCRCPCTDPITGMPMKTGECSRCTHQHGQGVLAA